MRQILKKQVSGIFIRIVQSQFQVIHNSFCFDFSLSFLDISLNPYSVDEPPVDNYNDGSNNNFSFLDVSFNDSVLLDITSSSKTEQYSSPSKPKGNYWKQNYRTFICESDSYVLMYLQPTLQHQFTQKKQSPIL